MIKDRCKLIAAIFIIYTTTYAQPNYFQQEVNYSIQVKLNDERHVLSGFESIQYINNSPKSIDYLYFHLWPNAYKTRNTALCKQLLDQGKTDLFFSDENERGWIDSINFLVNGVPIKWEYDPEHIDICKLFLNEPLRSLDTIEITTPFKVKIPDAKFSRLGHTGQAYFITQWYPKPAVYDNDGWHPMPYLDQGEFFSEFGSFEVDITLPKNYMLAATGDRIDASEEEDLLNENVAKTIERWDKDDFRTNEMDFPPSSKEWKTVKFKQYRVHDFAWFADKRFNVLHDQIELPNTKRVVDTWVFFTNRNFATWKNAISYVNEATIFYSYLLGDYPYNNITAVDGTIMAGGGMEYPNITVIGDMDNPFDLDVTIAHEVGHNWFYGILGSNERDYPYLDEGLNSLYEMRYIKAKYPDVKLTQYLGLNGNVKLFEANTIPFWKEKDLAYQFSARQNLDQPINTAAQDLNSMNYGCIIYAKTAVAFDYMMEYMGDENFDKAMRFYYEQYKFKHPSPTDLAKTLGFFHGKEPDWFYRHLIDTDDKIDYKIKSVKRRRDGSFDIKIKNRTNADVPFPVYGYKNGRILGYVWSEGFTGKANIGFPAADCDYFRIDGKERLPEINRKNNGMKVNGMFRKRDPLKLYLLTHLDNPKLTQVNILPFIGMNYYNGLMPGIAINNFGLIEKRFEFLLAPMFGIKTKTPTGFVEAKYRLHPKNVFNKITFGIKGKSFAYDKFETRYLNEQWNTSYDPANLNYYKITPYISFDVKKQKAVSKLDQNISLSSHQLFTDSIIYTELSNYATRGAVSKTGYSFVNSYKYTLIGKKALSPFNAEMELQHNSKMAKLSASFSQEIYLTKTHAFSYRIFAGTFLSGSATQRSPYAFRASGYNGYHDYLFNDNFLARNERNGLGFSQFSEQDGNLKSWTPLGQSNQWLASLNVKSPKIFLLPIRLYADAVVCDGRSLLNDQVLWNAGINVVIWKDIIDIYVPLVYSADIKNTFELNNVTFWNRIRFTLNLHKLAPDKILNNYLF